MTIILGVIASLIVQFAKRYSPDPYATLVILLVVSLAAAALYTSIVAAGYWDIVAGVLLTAGAFYSFIIQRFEGPSIG